jgi:tetratricopeptide (TPR) repeat protein
MALAMPHPGAQSQDYPDAPDAHALRENVSHENARKSPRPKTQAEYDTYKAAAALADPVKLEAAATDFAQRFPDSDLRSILFQQAMGLYQQANDPAKTLELARAALKYDPGNAVALLAAAQVLAERTHDDDLDRNDRFAEASADAQNALQNADSIPPPTNLTPEQFAAALAELRGAAHEVLGTVAFKKLDNITAIKEYDLAAAEEKEHTAAVVWLRLSVALERSGDPTRAAAIVPKAIAASAPGSQIRQLAEQEKSRLEKFSSVATKSAAK